MIRKLGIALVAIGVAGLGFSAMAPTAHATVTPLTITKTVTHSDPTPDGFVKYDIAIHNPNDAKVCLDTIVDTLPSGFDYTDKTTHGVFTNGDFTREPNDVGQTLTWNFDGECVDGLSTADLTFEADISIDETPGAYCNTATVNWDAGGSASTGLTAPVTVTSESSTGETTPNCPSGPPVPVRSATPTSTATPKATATATAAPATATATPKPKSTVLAAQVAPARAAAALPSTGAGHSGHDGWAAILAALAAASIALGTALALAGRRIR